VGFPAFLWCCALQDATRREDIMLQLKAVELAIARKRAEQQHES
jgi:hypothetical protein